MDYNSVADIMGLSSFV